MKSLRKLLEDRWLGGLLAAALIYFLVVQGVAAAVAQGSATGLLQDPNLIICSGFADHGRTGDPASPSGDGDHHAFCAVLCQASFAGTATIPGSTPTVHRIELYREVEAAGPPLLPARHFERPHVAEARAPPRQA